MPQDDGKVIRTPSEHSQQFVNSIVDQVYNLESNDSAEQSAIYRNVPFHALGGFKSLGIVLTAQCDIKQYNDSNYLLVARVTPIAGVFGYWLEKKKKYTEAEIMGDEPVADGKPKRRKVSKEFISLYMRNKTFPYFFLPELEGQIDASFICFEITQCIQLKHVEQLVKVCVLRSPLREAVPSHFSAYIGRVGTPEFPDDFLETTLDAVCKIQAS